VAEVADLRILIDRVPYAEANLGEEAILASLLKDLRRIGVKRIDILSDMPERTQLRHGPDVKVIANHKGMWFRLPNIVKAHDVLIWGGGHMLQDRSSQLYIPYVTKNLVLAKYYKKPRFIYAPGLGPVESNLGKRLSRLAIDGSEEIVVRNQELKAPVIGIAPRRHFYRKGSVLPASMQLAAKQENPQFDFFLQEIAAALDQLIFQDGAEVQFLAMDIGPNPRDDLICQRIKHHMVYNEKATVFDDDVPLDEFIRRLGNLDVLVSARLHGIIMGMRFGLPFVGIDSDGKIPRLAKQFELDDFVIKDTELRKENLYTSIKRAVGDNRALREHLAAHNSIISTASEENFGILEKTFKAISKKPK
jgi:polysaccharide pyruvyl transferase WcaK-like protein